MFITVKTSATFDIVKDADALRKFEDKMKEEGDEWLITKSSQYITYTLEKFFEGKIGENDSDL